ncbi:CHAT domain-containing protein [Kitasatospora sp. NPDC097691]|uniref:CHAT domain-containing protein n=1 Tax=Kitasatospora sp. NPDC097691 TaxID=3157231 RepID=UPI00332FF3F9
MVRRDAERVSAEIAKTLQAARAEAPKARPDRVTAYQDLIDRGLHGVPENTSEIIAFVADTIDNGKATRAQALGELNELVGRPAEAVECYREATTAWRVLGEVSAILDSSRTARRLQLELDRDLDAATLRLDTALEELAVAVAYDGAPIAHVEWAAAAVELAELYLKGGDPLECSLLLDRVRAGLPVDDADPSLAPLLQAMIDHDRAHDAFPRTLARQLGTVRAVRLLRCEITHLELMLRPTSGEAVRAFDSAARGVERMTDDLPWDNLTGLLGPLAMQVQAQHRRALARFSVTADAARELAVLDGRRAGAAAPPVDSARALQRCRKLAATLAGLDRQDRADAGDLPAIAERVAADLLLELGEPGRALDACERATGLLGTRRVDVRASILLTSARAHLALGRAASGPEAAQHSARARDTAARGMELVEGFRYLASGIYVRDAQLKPWIGLYRLAADVALELGDLDRFLRLVLASKGRRLSWGVRGLDAEAAAGLAELGGLVDEAYGDEAALDAARQLRRLGWDRQLAHLRVEPPPLPHGDDLRRRLEPGEAALFHYWLDERRLAVGLLAPEGLEVAVRVLTPEDRARLDADVALLLAEDTEVGKADRAARPVLDRLDAAVPLLLPDRPERLLGLSRLFISPHGVLHGFPLHLLRPDGAVELGAAVAVSYLPNLAGLCDPVPAPGPHTLVSLTRRARGPAGRPQRALDEFADHLRTLSELHTARGRAFEELTAEPDRLAFNAVLGVPGAERFGVVQIVTHGQNVPAAADSPLEARLWLAASELDGLDLASWHLDGAIVVLTACSSGQRALTGRAEVDGRPATLAGDEVFGLQAGCFAAGASAILGCLWPVAFPVAQAVTVEFHRELLAGHPPDRALQLAVATYRARHPGVLDRPSYRWGPFFLSTRGRPHALPARRIPTKEQTA